MVFTRITCIVMLISALSFISAAPLFARTKIIEGILPHYPAADTLDGNFLAGIIAGVSYDIRAAALYFGEALKDDPHNPDLRERAFVAYLANGSLPQAISLARDIARSDRQNGLAQLVLGVDAFQKKQYATARRFFNRSSNDSAGDLTAILLNAWSWAGSKNFPEAISTIDNLKGEALYNVFRDFHAGLLAAQLGNSREAEGRLAVAYAAEGTTLRVIDAFGRILSQRGKKDEAKIVYQKFDALLPRHPIVRNAIKELNKGRQLAALVSTPWQGAAEVLYGLGAAGSGEGDELAALIYLNLALYLDPHHALAAVTRGDILLRLKQYELAIDAFDKVSLKSPLRVSADIQIANTFNSLERPEDAVFYLEKALKNHPRDVDLLTSLGGLKQGQKKYVESIKIFDRAIKLIEESEPNYWSVYFFRGISHERANQWSKAESDLKKALEIGGEDIGSARAQILNYLGYSWVDRDENLEEAFEMLERAAELKPQDAYIADSLAWAYYKLGRYEEAVRELERAIELKPSEAIINDHLGDAYWRIGRKIEAVFQWNHARDLDPDPEELPQILEKIKNGLPDINHSTPVGAQKKKDNAEKAVLPHLKQSQN